jgi:O-antigen/teichoic acid export membrane protein
LKIQEHIDKISWTFSDKGIYVAFGFFSILFHINYLSPTDFGLFTHLNNLNIWILVISDGLALMNIIQFGVKEENRAKVNTIALIIHVSLTLSISLLLYALSVPLSDMFAEPRFSEVVSYLPFLVLLNIPRTYCMKFVYRNREFKKLFFIDMILFGSMMVVTLIIIYYNEQLILIDMVRIYFIGSFLGSASAIFLTRKDLKFSLKGDIKVITLIKFGIPLTLYNTLHSIPRNLDYFVVQYFFSTATVGIYSSAKQLFRFFEEAMIAANSMVYPVAVSQLERNDKKGLNDLMTKSISFMLIFFVALILFFELGFAEIFINFLLPEKYSLALGHFNILILGSLFLPFLMLATVITASGKPKLVLLFVAISVFVWFIAFVIIGYIGNEEYISIAMVVYLTTLGLLSLIYTSIKYKIKPIQLLRAFKDTKNFIYSYFDKKKEK